MVTYFLPVSVVRRLFDCKSFAERNDKCIVCSWILIISSSVWLQIFILGCNLSWMLKYSRDYQLLFALKSVHSSKGFGSLKHFDFCRSQNEKVQSFQIVWWCIRGSQKKDSNLRKLHLNFKKDHLLMKYAVKVVHRVTKTNHLRKKRSSYP